MDQVCLFAPSLICIIDQWSPITANCPLFAAQRSSPPTPVVVIAGVVFTQIHRRMPFIKVPEAEEGPSVSVSSSLCLQVDVSDATKTAEAFLKIASVYKEENNDVKNAVLDSIGETLCLTLHQSISCFVVHALASAKLTS